MRLPTVFIIGDSISIGYDFYLRKYLKGKFRYSRKQGNNEVIWNNDIPMGANGGDSSVVLKYLYGNYAHKEIYKVDYLLFNCGLHDIKIDPLKNDKQIPLSKYINNLRLILQIVNKYAHHIIWINTTPVDNYRHNTRQKDFYRFNEDVTEYNTAAELIMHENNIPIIDIYSFTLRCGQKLYTDHIHFKQTVCKNQAKYIARYLLEQYHLNVI